MPHLSLPSLLAQYACIGTNTHMIINTVLTETDIKYRY